MLTVPSGNSTLKDKRCCNAATLLFLPTLTSTVVLLEKELQFGIVIIKRVGSRDRLPVQGAAFIHSVLSAVETNGPTSSTILVEETIARFGVDPRSLSNGSGQLVVTDCAQCKCIRVKKFRDARKQRLCFRCANDQRAKSTALKRSAKMKTFYLGGGRHARKGVRHTADSREKMRKAWKGRVVSKETREKLSRAIYRSLLRDDVKERTKAINRLRVGPLASTFGKKPHHAKKVWFKGVCFRSSWESSFASYLDLNGVKWEYEPVTFRVEYALDGKTIAGTYTPDFRTSQGWYEVKGWWTREGTAKFDAFKAKYPDEKITVVDRAYLKALGILPVLTKHATPSQQRPHAT